MSTRSIHKNQKIREYYPIDVIAIPADDGSRDHHLRARPIWANQPPLERPAKSKGHVTGSKVSEVEFEQIQRLVDTGVYLNTSDFVREAIRDKLASIKVIKYRDLDYETAKREVRGYFEARGEAYPSDASADLEIDYELICQITEELQREGRMEAI